MTGPESSAAPDVPAGAKGPLAALPEDVSADLEAAVRAAVAGGRAVMPHYRREDLDVDDAGRGPVTEADRAGHRAILAALEALRPVDAVLSEESRDAFEGREGAGRLWVVDPLDGTREFIDRIDEFSVMVGLALNGAAILGAVFRPARKRLYFGAVGHGAWIADGNDASPLAVPEGRTEAIRLVRSRSHPDERLTALEEALGDGEVVLSGSAGTKCCRVAAGEADLYVHPVPFLKEWDTCAPEAVLRAAGGRVTDCFGGPLGYGEADPRQPRGIFAAAPATYDAVAPLVARVAEGL